MRTTLIRNQKGVAAIEFALLLPLLLLLLFGIIEFGAMLYNKAVLTNASREGSRSGIMGTDEKKIENIVRDYLDDGKLLINFDEPVEEEEEDEEEENPERLFITITGAQGPEGSPLTVNVSYTHRTVILPRFSTTLSTQTVMRIMENIE